MTDTTVTVEPAPIAPVVPEPAPIDPIRIKVYHGAYVPQFAMCLLPGKHTKDLAGHGVTWRPHKHSIEGTLGVLVVHDPQVLLDSDGDTVTLDRECTDHAALVGGWESFDPNGDPDKDDCGNAEEFKHRFGGRVWRREVTGAAVVWASETHDRTEKKTEWRRVTIAFGCDVARVEHASWYHPDSGAWAVSKGGMHEVSLVIDRKLRPIDGPEETRAMVETWTGPTWLGAPTPTAMLEQDEALRFIEAHNFRSNPNAAGAYVRCGTGMTAAHVAWPIGGASSSIAEAISRQAAQDFQPRPYWLREDGELPRAVDGKATVTFHKENPFLGSSLDSKLGWPMLTNAHLATNGADHQHEGHWLLVAAAALFGELWAEVAVELKSAMLALDRNFEKAATETSAKWLQIGRGRARPQCLAVMIAMSTRDPATFDRMQSTCWKWNDLRAKRRAFLNFPREAVAQVLTKFVDRGEPFFTGYEEARDTMAVFQSLQLFDPKDPIFRTTLREAILLGRLAASSMRDAEGKWKSGYQVPCNDEGRMLWTASFAGDTLRFWTLGGLLAYGAALVVAHEKALYLVDDIDRTMVVVAQRAAHVIGSQWSSFPARHSAAESLCALGQGALGTTTKAWAEMVPVAPVGTT